ncbi:penicillin-binding protein activator [Inmirania thermothiophila]|uniref:Penicillin-binding protein activator n=1 Tax=Inmirania thermothiophila TaxID=1750597 RepID=A0A3N1XWV2_9GAMM|nr:penicillin-binding protein activator [Inmirania thermothiophila]ROR29672.1 hypothetical protein EDC57_2343 [Inmirania thermothiophila]
MAPRRPGWRCLVAAAALTLASCTAPVKPPTVPAPSPPAAAPEVDAAVRALLQAAGEAAPGEAVRLRLEAARLLGAAGRDDEAAALLAPLDLSSASPEVALEAAILLAEHALARGVAAEALLRLPDAAPDAAPALRRRLHRLRAQAFAALGNALEAARARIALEPLLEEGEAVLENQRAILRHLTELGDDALARLEAGGERPLAGWAGLARIARSPRLPGDFDRAMAAWRQRHPDHPARPQLMEGVAARMRVEPLRPRTVALLLPLSGRLAAAGRAVRDGVLAAYLRTPPQERPRLVILDTRDGAEAGAAVEEAVREGAEAVIGPLAKDAVRALALRPALPLRVLALNYDDGGTPPPPRLHQLGLLPEDEAAQAAERARADGAVRALVLAPASRWGDRLVTAFRTRWETLGGELLDEARYDPRGTDHRPVLERLLDIDESKARRRALEAILGTGVRFEPRARADAEVLFLAADSTAARLILPQIRFLGGGRLAVYATSAIFTGRPDPRADRDLDGVRFADIPWLLAPDESGSALRRELEGLFPQGITVYGRLYALGYDAWQALPLLEWLGQGPDAGLTGLTGILTADPDRRLHRRLYWARFEEGRPQPLGWTPRIEGVGAAAAAP